MTEAYLGHMTWDEIEAFLLAFPDTEASLSWGMPGVKTGGRLVAWWRDRDDSPGSVAIKVDRAELPALVEPDSTPFYTIEHFRARGLSAVLVRPGEADARELRELLTEAWLMMASTTVREAWLVENGEDE